MKKTIKGATAFALAIMMIGTTFVTVFAATAQDMMNKNISGYTAGTQSVYGPKLTQEQLNAVADVVADFKTNYTNDSMTNDQKIRAGYDYIKNRVSYIDWDKGVGANTAYALVTGQGACSGMTRGFIALMDAVDVKAYLIHADTNDHQWILTEFDDGFAYIDIDANVSSGFEAIYHAKTHPYTYDTNGLPAIGSHSSNNGAKTAVTEGWKQDANGWWYQNADGSYPINTWQIVKEKWYYFESNGYLAINKWIEGNYYVGADGVMLTNTTTPDGYQVGSDGTCTQNKNQSNGIRAWMDGAQNGFGYHQEGYPLYYSETRLGVQNVSILDEHAFTFEFKRELGGNIEPTGHIIMIAGFIETNNGQLIALTKDGEPISYQFEYDKLYNLDFTGTNQDAKTLSNYCKANNVLIRVWVEDSTQDGSVVTWLGNYLAYATKDSVKTGRIDQ